MSRTGLYRVAGLCHARSIFEDPALQEEGWRCKKWNSLHLTYRRPASARYNQITYTSLGPPRWHSPPAGRLLSLTHLLRLSTIFLTDKNLRRTRQGLCR
jgi:hypothetical protein